MFIGDAENEDFDMHKELDMIVNNSNRNRSSRNANTRAAQSEKPNKSNTNGIMRNQPIYSISKTLNNDGDKLATGMQNI